MSRVNDLLMQTRKIERLERTWLMAKGAEKKKLRGMLHTAKKDLEDIQGSLGGIHKSGVQGGWAILEPRSRRFKR